MKKLIKKLLFIILISFTCILPATNGVVDMEKRNKEIFRVLEEQRLEEYRKEIIEIIEWKAEIIIPDYIDIEYIQYMYEVALEFNLPIRTIFRLINRESLFIENAVSPVGAYGFMQLMPGTYDEYHRKIFGNEFIEDYTPYKNIYIGMYYLRELRDYWGGFANNEDYAWKLALASYNAGKGRVIRYRGVPPFRETRNYVTYIMREHSKMVLFAQI